MKNERMKNYPYPCSSFFIFFSPIRSASSSKKAKAESWSDGLRYIFKSIISVCYWVPTSRHGESPNVCMISSPVMGLVHVR